LKGRDQVSEDPLAPARPTLGVLFTRLANQLRALIRAEIGLYRAEAEWRLVSLGWAAAFIFGALALVQALSVALLVGLILALAPLWGTGWAVAVVTFGGLAAAALLGWLGYRRVAAVLEPAPSDSPAADRPAESDLTS
jgi:Putative Actinobacterial Holin-X, holin superfamily III